METYYDFQNWSSEELFYHLIDLYQIPYEEEFDNWKDLRADMLRMCENTINHEKFR